MEEGIRLVALVSDLEPSPGKEVIQSLLRSYVHQFGVQEERVKGMEKLIDSKEEELVGLSIQLREKEEQVVKLLDQLKEKEELLTEADSKIRHMGTELRDQTDPRQDTAENKQLMARFKKLEDENKDLHSTLDAIEKDLQEGQEVSDQHAPGSLGHAAALLRMRKAELQRAELTNAELNIRLELEHDRRIRAQNLIGEIEKERIALKNQLESRSSEFAVKTQEYEEVRVGCDYKVRKVSTEMKRLEAKCEAQMSEKDSRLADMTAKNKELAAKLEDMEDRYANQVEVAKTLQSELQVSYEETQCLAKEMEMLNLMFAELEYHIFNPDSATNLGLEAPEVEVTQNGKKINVEEVLKAANGTGEPSKLLQESCFNEVTTKNGTRMVLSVSKTFIKLKDLILEKKTLEEQLTKMKNINQHLCSQVNLHEEKLWSITDELNSTWFYVSKIKEQHKKLHSAEQILRAELAEKRLLLNKLRQELEESRNSWNIVKQKTADSERQWLALKADFAERKRLLFASPVLSSESGFSEADTEETSTQNEDESESQASFANTSRGGAAIRMPIDVEKLDLRPLMPVVVATEAFASHSHDAGDVVDDGDDDDDEEIPDPFSDDEEEEEDQHVPQEPVYPDNPMISSTTTITPDQPWHEDEAEEEEEQAPHPVPLFVPSLSYLAHVPTTLMPTLLNPEDFVKPYYESVPSMPDPDRLEDHALEEVDDNVRDLITRLMSSTARGAFLASRLSDIHRRIATGDSLTGHNQWFDEASGEEDADEEDQDTDLDEPRDMMDDEGELAAHSGEQEEEAEPLSYRATSSSLSSTTLSEMSSSGGVGGDAEHQHPGDGRIPTPPPMPTFSLMPPSAGITVRPTFQQSDDDDDDEEEEGGSSDEEGERRRRRHGLGGRRRRDSQSPESSTAMTRFLIKHLPQQLARLRNEKSELEDKIRELESLVSLQRYSLAEQERRADKERNRADRLEERMQEVEKSLAESTVQRPEICSTSSMTFPVVLDKGGQVITWQIVNKHQAPPGYWLGYLTPHEEEAAREVVLPSHVVEVLPITHQNTLITTLRVDCCHPGTFTLHIDGIEHGLVPHVTVSVSAAAENQH